MNFRKIMPVMLILLVILTIGVVSASDENITDDNLAVSEDLDVESSIGDTDIKSNDKPMTENEILSTDNNALDDAIQKEDIADSLNSTKNNDLATGELNTDIIITVEGRPTTEATIIQLSLDERITGQVKIYEEEYSVYNVNVINGKGEYVLEGLDTGEHKFTAKFEGNNDFGTSSNVTSFYVYEDPCLTVYDFPERLYALDDLTFEFSMSGIYDKYDVGFVNITLVHGNKTQNMELHRKDIWDDDMEGVYWVPVTFESLESGNYTFRIYSYNYGSYGDSRIVKTFNVLVKNPKLSIDASNISKGETETITISIDSKFDGNVTCLINKAEYPLDFTDGKANLILDNLDYGDYEIYVEAFNSSNFARQNVTKSFRVSNDPNLEVAADNVIYGQTAYVYISIKEDITGNLTVYINDESYPIALSQGKCTIPLADLPKGRYIVRAEFEGDDNYLSSEKSVEFVVSSDPDVAPLSDLIDEFSGGTLVLQKDYMINSSIDIAQPITIDGNGHHIDAKGLSGIFNIKANDVYLKNIVFKNAYSTSDGGAVYSSYCDVYCTNCTFVNCSSTSYGGALYGNYGQISDCTFLGCKADYGGAVYLYTSYSKYGTIDNSKFIDCSATFSGGAFYGRDITNCYILNCTAKYGGGVYTRGNLVNVTIENCSATTRGGGVNWVYLAYTGNMYNSTLINCYAPKGSFIYTGGDEMVHYNCYDTKFENVRDASKMNAAEQNLPVLINCTTLLSSRLEVGISAINEKSAIVSISILPEANGTVTLSVNGNTQNVELTDGKKNVTLTDLTIGNPIIVKFIAGEGFSNMSQTVIFQGSTNTDDNQTPPAPVTYPVNVIASDLSMLYSSNSAFRVTVYGTDGKLAPGASVAIIVGGKTVATVKTDANGVATYIPTQTPGTYKISATALGKTVTKTLTVKHVVTLKTVKVKKSAKKLVLQATLAKVNGKVLKNAKVTFKFNGKKYTAKTNKKGVAKITIKKSVLKKLKVGKKVTYQATYLKDTVKKSVKVKK